MRWEVMLEDFYYEIEHPSGCRIPHVDGLIRFPVMMITRDSVLLKLKFAQENDDEVWVIKGILKTKPYKNYYIKGDKICGWHLTSSYCNCHAD